MTFSYPVLMYLLKQLIYASNITATLKECHLSQFIDMIYTVKSKLLSKGRNALISPKAWTSKGRKVTADQFVSSVNTAETQRQNKTQKYHRNIVMMKTSFQNIYLLWYLKVRGLQILNTDDSRCLDWVFQSITHCFRIPNWIVLENFLLTLTGKYETKVIFLVL